MKFLSIFHYVPFLLISFNLLLVINTIQLNQFMYRSPILESKQNNVLSNNYIHFSSDRVVPSEGTTYKKAIILGFDKDDFNKTMKNNKTSFSFKESEEKKEIVEVNVKDNMSKKEKIENQLVKNLSYMIKDVISSLYIKDTNRTEVLNTTIDSYKNRFNIILKEMINLNEPVVIKEAKKNENIATNSTLELKSKEIIEKKKDIQYPVQVEKKEIPIRNIEADDSSIVSEILKKYKN